MAKTTTYYELYVNGEIVYTAEDLDEAVDSIENSADDGDDIEIRECKNVKAGTVEYPPMKVKWRKA